MRKGPIANVDDGREIRKRIIRLIFDGTSGPMQFEVALTDWTWRESGARRDDRSPAMAR
jgi:hypothetical protein